MHLTKVHDTRSENWRHKSPVSATLLRVSLRQFRMRKHIRKETSEQKYRNYRHVSKTRTQILVQNFHVLPNNYTLGVACISALLSAMSCLFLFRRQKFSSRRIWNEKPTSEIRRVCHGPNRLYFVVNSLKKSRLETSAMERT